MARTLGELARAIGGDADGDEEVLLERCAPIAEAGPGDLTFVASQQYMKDLATTHASAVIVAPGVEVAPARPAIRAKNPCLAFARAVAILHGPGPRRVTGVDPSAVVAESAVLGEGVNVGPLASVGPGARLGDRVDVRAGARVGEGATIGDDTTVYENAVLYAGVAIGRRCAIHAGAVIGADGFGYATEAGVHHKVPQIGTVVIEDDVEIGANTTVDRAALGATRIGRGTKIDNLCHVAHNVQIGEGCLLAAQVGISGSSSLGRFVTLAGQVGVSGHISLGDGVIVAAQSGVPNDIPAGEVHFGYPAGPIKEVRRIVASWKKLPDLLSRVREMERRLKGLEGRGAGGG